jgi:hypothetical protein
VITTIGIIGYFAGTRVRSQEADVEVVPSTP